MKTVRSAVGIALSAVLLAGILGATSASAQIYPTPGGYCVFSLSDPLPNTASTVTLLATAADQAGNPLEGVDGNVAITSQPGDSARLQPTSFVTGVEGTADLILHTGDTPGTIEIVGECGDAEVRATVQVGDPPGPPATGTGPSGDASSTSAAAAAAGAAALLGAGVIGLIRRRGSGVA